MSWPPEISSVAERNGEMNVRPKGCSEEDPEWVGI